MTSYVLDAGVAAKWFLRVNEPLADEALQLLQGYRSGEVEFIVPDLFFAEFANLLRKAQVRGRCGPAIANSAIRDVLTIGFPSYPSAILVERAVLIARRYQRTVYDSIYVALAVEMSANVVTADERLANSLPGLPVVWLGLL